MADLKTRIVFSAEGAPRTVGEIKQMIASLEAQNNAVKSLAQQLGISGQQAAEFAQSLGLAAPQVARAVAALREMEVQGVSNRQKYLELNRELGLTPEQILKIEKSASLLQLDRLQKEAQGLGQGLGQVGAEGSGAMDGVRSSTNILAGSVTELYSKYMLVLGIFHQMMAAAKPLYHLLIEQNEHLENQILATSSSIAATNRIMLDGVEMTDPSEAITALLYRVDEAKERIRVGSLELVGVTSGQLIDSFQIIAGQLGEIGIDLDQAADLTLDFAAAMGTLKMPMFQARQEITSIFQGSIDNNSQIAKTLGITNEQVRKLKEQGQLYDFLRDKLSAFRAGNQMAMNTIDGINSNIQEMIEIIGLELGEPLRRRMIEPMADFLAFLTANQEKITTFLQEVVRIVEDVSGAIWDGLMTGFEAVQPVLERLRGEMQRLWDDGSFQEGIRAIGDGLGQFAQTTMELVGLLYTVFEPLVTLLIQTFPIALKVAGTALEQFSFWMTAVVRGLQIMYDALAAFPDTIARAFAPLSPQIAEASNALGTLDESVRGLTLTMIEFAAGGNRSVDGFFDNLITRISDPAVRGFLKTLKVVIGDVGHEFGLVGDDAIAGTDQIKDASQQLLDDIAGGATGVGDKIGEQVEAIDKQIKALRSARVTGKENREEVDRQVAALEKYKKALKEAATGVEILENFQREQQRVLAEIGRETKIFSKQLELGEQEQQNTVARLANEGVARVEETEQRKLQIKLQRIRDELKFEQENLAKIARLQGDPEERENAVREAKLKVAKLSAALIENEAQQQKNAIAQIEQQTRDSLAILQLAEQERQNAIQVLLNDGLIRQDQAERKRLQSTRNRLEGELAAEQEKLTKLEAAEGQNFEAIRAQKQKLAEITGRLLDNEFQQQQKLREYIIRKITEAEQLQAKSLDLQVRRLERINTLAGQQERITQSQLGLQQALDRLAKSRSDLAIATAETQLTALRESGASQEAIEARERSILNLKLKALEVSQSAAARDLEFQIAAEERANKRLQIEAAIAKLKAQQEVIQQQAALARLQQDPDASPEQIQQAQELLDLTRQQAEETNNLLDIAKQEAEQIQETARIRRETLKNDQERERIQLSAQGIRGRAAAQSQPSFAGQPGSTQQPGLQMSSSRGGSGVSSRSQSLALGTPSIQLGMGRGAIAPPPLPQVAAVRPDPTARGILGELEGISGIVKNLSGQVEGLGRPNISVTNNSNAGQSSRSNQLGALAL